MLTFLGKRLLSGVILVVVIGSITFFLLSAGGTSIARTLLGETATQDQIAAKVSELGLDRNVFARYWDWISHAVTGQFGNSYLSNEPVTQALLNRLPVTLSIAIGAIVVTAILSVTLGVLAAVYRGWIDKLVQILAVVGFAMPGVWFALLLILWLAIGAKAFPATGYVPLTESVSGWAISLVLPVSAIAFGAIASTAQQVRSAMIETLDADYIRTLNSRGLSSWSVIVKHALRNASPTGLTVLSLQFISLLGSTVVIEKIFALPGIGSLVLNATISGDSPQVLGVVVMMVIAVVVVNLVIDVLNGWLNPKVRVS